MILEAAQLLLVVLHLPYSWSNWNLEVFGFEGRGKPEYPVKNLSEQRREPTTNSTHIWCRCQDLNLGHIDGRQVLSTLCHCCSKFQTASNSNKFVVLNFSHVL